MNCIGCGEELKIKSEDKKHCEKDGCKREYFWRVTDDIIIRSYNNDKDNFRLIVDIFYSIFNAVGAEEKLKPLPLVKGVETYTELKNKIKKERLENKYEDLYENIESSKTDDEVRKKIGEIEYNIIKFVISENKYKLMYKRGTDDYEIYTIYYTPEREEEIKEIKERNEMKNSYLFHGSNYMNWYTIIKYGLKVYSGTKLMTAGAAYGIGIYLSDNYGLSIGYSQVNMNNKYQIIGIVELLDDEIKYKKAEQIYVVADESKIVLREIVLIKKQKPELIKVFNRYKNIGKINAIFVNYDSKITDKRLKMEIKKIEKMDKIRISEIEKDRWMLMMIYDYEIVNVEIRFMNYPFTPPMVKIIEKPEIKISEYVKMLEVSRWKISNNIGEVMKILYDIYNKNFII